MTRESVKRLIKFKRIQLEVEEHFANGGEVEVISLTPNSKWQHAPSPNFDWESFDYRIKKPQTHRPFGKGDNLLGFVVREKGDNTHLHLITEQHDLGGGVVSYRAGQSSVTNARLLEDYEISMDGCNTWSTAGVPLPKAEQPAENAAPSHDPNWKPGNHPE